MPPGLVEGGRWLQKNKILEGEGGERGREGREGKEGEGEGERG